ncbi:hypothetical protein JXR93_13715 [bacterium]|nr:hypothetical protein [bacterium]
MRWLIIFTFLLGVTVFAEPKKNFEEMFEKINTKKYELLKEELALSEKVEKNVVPIMKKYDKKIFELRSAHMKDGIELRRAVKKDYNKILAHQKAGIALQKKVLILLEEEIAEVEKAGVDSETIVALMKFEKRFMRDFIHNAKKHHKGKNGGFGNGPRGGGPRGGDDDFGPIDEF